MPNYAVPIVLADGKERHLRYDWNALEALEESAGIDLTSLPEVMKDKKRLSRNVRMIMWAGLIHEDESLTPKAVGSLMMPLTEMSAWVERITAAFRLAFGSDEGEPKNAGTPGPGTPGTGTNT